MLTSGEEHLRKLTTW